MAQNPLGGYVDDDEDLPAAPVAQQPAVPAQPRNEHGQFTSPAAVPAPAVQAVQQAPQQQQQVTPAGQPAVQHHPYMVSRARALGIDPSTMTPDVLGAVLGAVEANQATAARQAPPAAPVAPAPEPALDWGEDDQGNPITSEEQAKKLYPRALFNAIKASHQVPVLAKQNAELQQTIERDRQERQAVAFDRKLTKHLATTRPDLFGADVDPNLVAQRKAAVEDHIGRLFAAKTQTTLQNDVAAALTIYGPGPAAQPAAGTMPGAKGPSPVEIAAGYRQAELARATGRRETLVMTREQRMLAEEVARQQERNNGSVLVAGEDDNSDLPDAPKG